MSTEKPLLAYAVQETCENTGGIVFARHSVTARRLGAGTFSDGDFSSVTCRRAPWADEFADQGDVPVRVAVEHGWHFECHGCGRMLTSDEDDCDKIVGTMESAVYCCAECEARYHATEAAKKAFGEVVLAHIREWVVARLGPVQFAKEQFKGHAYVTGGNGEPLVVNQAVVSFEFPGQEIAPASLRWDNDYREIRVGHRWVNPCGPRAPECSVCNGDLKAFEAFAERVRSDRASRQAAA